MRDSSSISRRRFLKLLTAATSAAYIGCSGERGPTGGSGRVIVIGAGLAGLSTAYELTRGGHEVVLLEAQARSGGRVHTVREGLAGGLYAEAGAVRVPDVHLHTLDYISRFGLDLAQFAPDNPVHYLKGNRFTRREGDPWPANFALNDVEREKGLRAKQDYISAYFPEVGDGTQPDWPPASALSYDAMTLADFLRAKGASEDFILLYQSDVGTEIHTANALAWVALDYLDRLWDKTFTIQGGNDQLPRKLEEELGDRIRFESPVMRIEHGADEVKVTYLKAGRAETLVGSRVVCALPVPLLRELEISPAFSDEKSRAVAEHTMMSAGRVYVQTTRRFWQDEGLTGLKIARTDLPIERIWDTASHLPGEAGLLMCYVENDHARNLCALSEAQRLELVKGEAAKVFPTFTDEMAGPTLQKCWDLDPWTRGAWSSLGPGRAWILRALSRAEGRVHFCGEHTSIWGGWMNGALESGKRVSAEIGAAEPVMESAAVARRFLGRRVS